MGLCVSADIGSTWTKAALIDLGENPPAVLRQAGLPTTQDDLSRGFSDAVRSLFDLPEDASLSQLPSGAALYVSSSAKGGLSIAAIGVVPDLTVKVARLAAASAGGRIAAWYSYRLSASQAAEIGRMRPDIVLLCGGTDGGNETHLRANARTLAASNIDSAVLYAGNAALADEVRGILGNGRVIVTENVMPEVGRLNIEPARAAIRGLFLKRIVEGRGLRKIRELCAADPKPTPLAVYELVEAMAGRASDWTETALVDMGGATTDVYSHCRAFRGEEGTVLRGLTEPVLTRTVEGDLGLRVSAEAAAETGRAYIERRLAEAGASADAFSSWVKRAACTPEIIASMAEDRLFDRILAEACLYHALLRHAGTMEETWTPGGKVRVQRGKDLRRVRRLIASGGWLARAGDPQVPLRALGAARLDSGGASLVPEDPEILADARYLLPLLGNLAADHPAEAAALAAASLDPLTETPGRRA